MFGLIIFIILMILIILGCYFLAKMEGYLIKINENNNKIFEKRMKDDIELLKNLISDIALNIDYVITLWLIDKSYVMKEIFDYKNIEYKIFKEGFNDFIILTKNGDLYLNSLMPININEINELRISKNDEYRHIRLSVYTYDFNTPIINYVVKYYEKFDRNEIFDNLEELIASINILKKIK